MMVIMIWHATMTANLIWLHYVPIAAVFIPSFLCSTWLCVPQRHYSLPLSRAQRNAAPALESAIWDTTRTNCDRWYHAPSLAQLSNSHAYAWCYRKGASSTSIRQTRRRKLTSLSCSRTHSLARHKHSRLCWYVYVLASESVRLWGGWLHMGFSKSSKTVLSPWSADKLTKNNVGMGARRERAPETNRMAAEPQVKWEKSCPIP